MNELPSTVQEVASWLSEYVKEWGSTNGTARLLTDLGSDFKKTFGVPFLSLARQLDFGPSFQKMAPFIGIYCPNLELVTVGAGFERAAVRERGSSLPHPLTDTGQSRPSVRKRYQPAFWAAFIKRVQPQFKRYLEIEPLLRFTDLPDSIEKTANSYEIPADLIVGLDASELVEPGSVLKNIDEWLRKNGLNEDHFLVKEQAVNLISSILPNRTLTHGGSFMSTREISVEFFKIIPAELRRNWEIPADIVFYLLEQK
jgi:hypothetical protein